MITMFLAEVLGWFLVIVSMVFLLRFDHFKAVATDIMSRPGLFFVWAIIAVIFGLLMVISHNIWIMGWPVVITIFAWLVLIGGLARLYFPDAVIRGGLSMINNPTRLRIMGGVVLLFGLFLLMHAQHIYF